MAELISPSTKKQKKGTKNCQRKKHSTRVDLTPMVDLGFLLITFFIFTTTLNEAKSMQLMLPKEDGEATKAPETGALTLIPDNDKVWYYRGLLKDQKNGLPTANYSGGEDIRKVILSLKKDLIHLRGNDQNMVVMIKPTTNSNFKNTIDVLDEMTINQVARYALMSISPEEEMLVKNK